MDRYLMTASMALMPSNAQ